MRYLGRVCGVLLLITTSVYATQLPPTPNTAVATPVIAERGAFDADRWNAIIENIWTRATADGVSEKTKFEVLLGKQVAGRTTTSKADVTLQVVEVVAGDLARCKVTGKDAVTVGAAVQAYASDPTTALPVQIKMLPPRDMQGWF